MMVFPDALSAPNATLKNLTADIKLIRASLLMLLFMTTAFSGVIWNAMRDLPAALKPIEALPVALFSLVFIIVAHVYMRADRIARVCARPVHDRESAPVRQES
jgi:hypothetical protein